jgi:type I restriction enzyme S subunit
MEVKPGYKQTEAGVIPENWEVESFNQTLKRQNAKAFQIQTSAYLPNGLLPVVDQSQNAIAGYTDETDRRFKCSEEGVIVFGDHTCVVKFVDFDFVVGADGTQLLTAKHENSTRFHAYALEHKGVLSTGYNRHFKFLKERLFVRPPLLEQRAIATALSDIDGLLGGLDRLIAKKRDLKQAAMQQLLTGEIRLPGFNSEWRKVKISDLCEYVSGTKTSGGDEGYVEIGDVDVVRKSYSLSQKEKLSVSGAVSVPAGTLLISTVRPTRGAITITNESCYVSSAFCRLRPTNGLLFHLVCQPQFLAYLGENAIGGTYPTCRDETILDYETAVPRDHEEQIAIATLLFDMDAESAALEARRDKIQALKQGMMQELLSGRIRLLQPEALHA